MGFSLQRNFSLLRRPGLLQRFVAAAHQQVLRAACESGKQTVSLPIGTSHWAISTSLLEEIMATGGLARPVSLGCRSRREQLAKKSVHKTAPCDRIPAPPTQPRQWN
jgi:hypothetical protein